MKKITLFILTALLTQLSFSQTMTVHKKNQAPVEFELSKIDSITFSIETSIFPITLNGRQIRGLAYEAGFLWAIHSPVAFGDSVKISKINPDDGQIVLESSQYRWNGRGITVGAGALWVADARADFIWKIDPSNFSQLASFSTPGSEPTGIAFDGANLWLVDPYFQKIYQLNTSGSVISSFNIPNAFRAGLEWEGSGMWTNTDTDKVSFYTTSGTITSTKTLSALPSGREVFDIAIGNGRVYISSGDKIYVENWNP